MADCPHTGTRLLDWLYDELGPPERAQFDGHLHTCAACRETGASLGSVRAAMRTWPDHEPPPALSAQLMRVATREALGAPVASGRVWARVHAWLMRGLPLTSMHPALAAAATLVLVAGVVGTLHLRGVREEAASHLVSVRTSVAQRTDEAGPAPEPPPLSPSPAASTTPTTTLAAGPREDAWQGQAPAREPTRKLDKEPARKQGKAVEIGDDRGNRGAGEGATGGAAQVRKGVLTGKPRDEDVLGDELDMVREAPQKRPAGSMRDARPALAASESAGAPAPGTVQRAGAPAKAEAVDEPAQERGEDRGARADGAERAGRGDRYGQDDRDDREALEDLHHRLRQALRSRACSSAVFLGSALRERDEAYYRRHVAGDEDFAGCVRIERKRARRAAEERAGKGAQPAGKP